MDKNNLPRTLFMLGKGWQIKYITQELHNNWFDLFQAKMDKKSLLRILSKLGKDGQIKNITVQLQLDEKTKVYSLYDCRFNHFIIFNFILWGWGL